MHILSDSQAHISATLDEAIKLFKSNKFSDAIQHLSGILHIDPRHKEALAYTGLAELNSGNPERALALIQQVITLYPDDPLGYEFLGTITNQLARFDESISAFSETARLKPKSSAAYWNLGITLMSVGESCYAADSFRKALALDPNDMKAYCGLGGVLADMGKYESSFDVFENALRIQPYNIDILTQYALAMISNGEIGDGFALLDDTQRMFPDHPKALRANAFANLNDGSAQKALECFETLGPLDSTDEPVFEGYAYALLKNRETEKADLVLNEYLKRHNHSTRTLALESIIQHELGNDEKSQAILDFENLFHASDIRIYESRMDKSDTFFELSQEIYQHPTLLESPRTHATRNGLHSGELFRHAGTALNLLKEQVERHVATYIETARRRLDPGHPFIANIPNKYRIYTWTIVLKDQGYQKQHIHPGGWLSGVVYIQLPDAMRTAADRQEGWIEFGEPPEGFPWQRSPLLRGVQPEVGKIVLFPSYYYHKTIPFNADQHRISVAFDVIPTSY